MPGARLPLRDSILSFSHTFLLKSARVGGPRLPLTGPRPPPPTENPGSATVVVCNVAMFSDSIILHILIVASYKTKFYLRLRAVEDPGFPVMGRQLNSIGWGRRCPTQEWSYGHSLHLIQTDVNIRSEDIVT